MSINPTILSSELDAFVAAVATSAETGPALVKATSADAAAKLAVTTTYEQLAADLKAFAENGPTVADVQAAPLAGDALKWIAFVTKWLPQVEALVAGIVADVAKAGPQAASAPFFGNGRFINLLVSVAPQIIQIVTAIAGAGGPGTPAKPPAA